jgi:hypothetical protein
LTVDEGWGGIATETRDGSGFYHTKNNVISATSETERNTHDGTIA